MALVLLQDPLMNKTMSLVALTFCFLLSFWGQISSAQSSPPDRKWSLLNQRNDTDLMVRTYNEILRLETNKRNSVLQETLVDPSGQIYSYDRQLNYINVLKILGEGQLGLMSLEADYLKDKRKDADYSYQVSYANLSLAPSARGKADLCRMHQQKFALNEYLAHSSNRMSFTNSGGILKLGTCWWHTSLVWSAGALAYYSPDLLPPDRKQVENILEALWSRNQVVEIPGYYDWKSFSKDWQLVIQSKLDEWQRREVWQGSWVRSLEGNNEVRPEVLQQQIEGFYQRIHLHAQPQYAMLQMKGVFAHSWLILDVQKKDAQTYDLYVMDSNTLSVDKWTYQVGMTHFTYDISHLGNTKVRSFVPYATGFEKGYAAQIENTLRRECR